MAKRIVGFGRNQSEDVSSNNLELSERIAKAKKEEHERNLKHLSDLIRMIYDFRGPNERKVFISTLELVHLMEGIEIVSPVLLIELLESSDVKIQKIDGSLYWVLYELETQADYPSVSCPFTPVI